MEEVPVEDLEKFLDYLQNAFDGIDQKMRRKMEGALFGNSWKNTIQEIDPMIEEVDPYRHECKYGVVAFAKSSAKKSFDFAYCLFKMDIKIKPWRIEWIKKEKSLLFGLFKWETVEPIKCKAESVRGKNMKKITNFFRYKALEEFCQQGVIDRVNEVASLENATDDIDNVN